MTHSIPQYAHSPLLLSIVIWKYSTVNVGYDNEHENTICGIFHPSKCYFMIAVFCLSFFGSSVLVLDWHCCNTKNHINLWLTAASGKDLVLGNDDLLTSIVGHIINPLMMMMIHMRVGCTPWIFNRNYNPGPKTWKHSPQT